MQPLYPDRDACALQMGCHGVAVDVPPPGKLGHLGAGLVGRDELGNLVLRQLVCACFAAVTCRGRGSLST